MDSQRATELYFNHSSAMAYIEVEKPNGDIGIGSCFHVGDGVFVTARHVIENNTITQIRVTEPIKVPFHEIQPTVDPILSKRNDDAIERLSGFRPLWPKWLEPLVLADGPYTPDDANMDLAIFRVQEIHPSAAHVRLGNHWDDWIHRYPWQLSDAIVLGFPPIPMTRGPELIAARAEIHRFVYLRHCKHIHFIVSAMPRGGFSGGVLLHETGFAVGVITSSLVADGAQTELGFMAVLSVEPIRVLLEKHGLLPACQLDVPG